jgi:hypothetical protein
MKPSNYLYGFFGGFLGFLLASTLVLHDGWARLTKFREANPTTNASFYFGSFLLIPGLLFIGLLGSPFIAAYAAYICGKNETLQPLVNTLTAPYITEPGENRFLGNINAGMLMGYSSILLLTSFTLLNIMTGNAFGMLGAAGAALFSAFGVSQSSLLGSFFATVGLTYLGGLSGGALGAGSTFISDKCFGQPDLSAGAEPSYHELEELVPDNASTQTQTAALTDNANAQTQANSPTPRPSLFAYRWERKKTTPMDDLLANDDSEEEEETEQIYFGKADEQEGAKSPRAESPPL